MTKEEAIKVLTHLREIIRTIPKALCKLSNVEEYKRKGIVALRMAIEALSIESVPIEDVWRGVQPLKDKILELEEKLYLQKERQNGEWIPCSERLPSGDEYVIVSVLDDHGDTPWKYTTVAWLCNGVWISDNDILCGTTVAWQPLSKPYREENEE